MSSKINKNDVYEIQITLERFCSYQDRCCKEVEKKIDSYKINAKSRDRIISHLLEQDYLNDERFAKSFTIGKFSLKQWGKNRIVAELKHRQISSENIRKALKEIPQKEYEETFNYISELKWKVLSKEESLSKKTKKWYDYLIVKGFENDIILSKLSELKSL